MIETASLEISETWKNGATPLSLAERAYHLILDRMLRGSLPIGSVLSRRKLAEEFHMSLVPVAQALQRLEIEGLLESRPRAGTRVKVPNADEIRERFELRQALECQSARLCAERASFQERLEIGRLAVNLDALQATVRGEEQSGERVFAVNKYHEDLHTRIAECARSELLKSQIEKSHVLRFNSLYDASSGRRSLPTDFHRDLIAVIVKGDSQEAEDAMRQHVMYGLKSIQRTMEPLQRINWRLKH
jgi:DNA-binding GntR family transcriptional regulator